MKIIFFSGLLTAMLCCTAGLSGQSIYIEDGASLYLAPSSTVYTVGTTTVEGTLAGSGTLTTNAVNMGTTGRISPGASVGTLNIVGDLNLNDGTYVCEINGISSFDIINVTGTATINSTDSKLELNFGYNPSLGNTFAIMTATAGVPGTWAVGKVTITGGNVAEISGGGVIAIALLPVELIGFSARETSGKVALEWRTASELNNAAFEIQRSTGNSNHDWEAIGNVTGHGTSLVEHAYSFTDVRPQSGENYYRLKQMDMDGSYEYSEVVSVNMAKMQREMRIFPNPATDFITLNFDTDFTGQANLSLFDYAGKKVAGSSFQLDGQALSTSIDLTGMPSGFYLVEIVAGNSRWQELLVVD